MDHGDNFLTRFGDTVSELTTPETNPDFVYRYRSVETSYFATEIKRLLRSKEIYWPIYQELNDPFDCQPKLHKGVTFKEFRQRIFPVLVLIQVQVSRELQDWKISDEDIKKIAKHQLSSVTFREIRHLYEERFQNIVQMSLRDVAVLSLCEDYNNPVMWSMNFASKTATAPSATRLRTISGLSPAGLSVSSRHDEITLAGGRQS